MRKREIKPTNEMKQKLITPQKTSFEFMKCQIR